MPSATADWLEAGRDQAWRDYLAAPPPDRVTHVWRYTDPAEFGMITDRGRLAPAGPLINPLEVPPGVQVKPLALATGGTDGERVRAELGSLVGGGHGKLEALNLAAWQDGLYVRVPAGHGDDNPIFLNTALTRPLNASRLLVSVGDRASLTLVRTFTSGEHPGAALANEVIEILAGRDAKVRLVLIQELARTDRLFSTSRILAAAGAKAETLVVSLGGKAAKMDIGTILAGEGADSESWGVILGDAGQHFDHHTVHEHRAGRTHSNFDYKTVLRTNARSVYTGVIQIDAGAKGCEAYQENRNLMLDKTAKADSIPELEILNDEVRCTHGATMGPIEPDYIFYLESRGIPRPEAIRIYIEGFVEPALARLPAALQAGLKSRIDQRLGSLA